MECFFPTKNILRYVLSMFSPHRSREASSEICGMPGIHSLTDILRSLYARYGVQGLLKGDVLLFGWALLLTALSDIFLGRIRILQTAAGAVICFLMCHVMDEDAPRAFLLTAFIVVNCYIGGLWVVTALFIVLFIHIGLKEQVQ